jgi:hypothetical protein
MRRANPEKCGGLTLDRRTFLGGAGLAAGAVVAATLVPLSLGREAAAGPVLTVAALDAGWHVDDMWGHAPRYAHAIPYGRVPGESIAWERIDPIDRMFVS